jgi:uncharacterized protein (DUF2062 family)
MKRIWRSIRRNVIKIASIDSTPIKIAAGIGIGGFIAMFPITGFQFITGIILSIIFRVNKVAVVVTTQLICNPLTLAFLFFLDFKIGEKLLGIDSSITLQSIRLLLEEANLKNFFSVIKGIAKPLYLGSAVTGPIVGLLAFAIGYLLVKRFKRRLIGKGKYK